MADQNRTEPDWQDVRVFVALARHGSLSATARALGINHATVARRMKSLERSLGETLMDRRPDGYVLTRAGVALFEPASAMEAAADLLSRSQPDDQPRGVVRINAPPSLAQGFLISHLAQLVEKHPGLDLEVATDVRSVSLDRRETDIALRLARPEDGDVVATHLVSFDFAFYGNAEWYRRAVEGEELCFVGFDEFNRHLRDAVWLATHFPKARSTFCTSSHLGQAAAAEAGAGLALLPHFVARRYNELKICPIEPTPPTQNIWMVTRRKDHANLPIQIARTFLRDIFERDAALFLAPTQIGRDQNSDLVS